MLSSTDQQISPPTLLPDLDRPPNEEEVKKAIKQLSIGKATVADAVHAEVYKHGGDTQLQKSTYIFCRIWHDEVIPQQLKYASIIRLYKKGNRQLCDNYRGISLLAIAGKRFARMLLNRMIVHLKKAYFRRFNAASWVAVGPST